VEWVFFFFEDGGVSFLGGEAARMFNPPFHCICAAFHLFAFCFLGMEPLAWIPVTFSSGGSKMVGSLLVIWSTLGLFTCGRLVLLGVSILFLWRFFFPFLFFFVSAAFRVGR